MYARPKLTDSVSVSEMMALRESGLTNAEIAQRLDTSVSSVIKYIGKQPPHLHKPTGYHAHKARKVAEELKRQREEDEAARKKAEDIWNEKLAAAQAAMAAEEETVEVIHITEPAGHETVDAILDEEPVRFAEDDFPSIMKANREPVWEGGLKVISRVTHAESATARYTVDTFAGQVKVTNKATNLTDIYTAEELQARIDELSEILAMMK